MIRSPLVLGCALVAIALPSALSSQAIADKPNNPTPTRPNTPGITWERSGGIAGICQRFTVRPSATYVLEDCRQQKVIDQGTLPATERTRLQTQWLKRYGSFQWQNAIRGADMFSDRYSFVGQGRQQPTALEKAALNQYLSELAGTIARDAQVANNPNGMLEGEVFIGPNCPVVRPDVPCPDRPYQATLAIRDRQNRLVQRLQTDTQGKFRVVLAPGTYTVQPESTGALPIADSQTVTVVKGQTTPIKITYDSGLR